MLLDEKRKKIDAIDQQMFELLNQRFELSKEVGIIKASSNVVVLDQGREDKIITAIKLNNLENETQIIELYQTLFELSKKLQ